jgi:hypothetical protein
MAGWRAGAIYFAMVFGLGFILGALRVTLIVPRLGALRAVLLEAPVMVIVSWFACQWLVQRLAVPGDTASRALMGGFAFALLLLAEFLVSVLLLGRTPAAHFAAYANPAAIIGLAAQALFAAFPLWQGWQKP